MLFIPPMAWEFLKEHRYLEKHPHTAPAYHDQRPRFRAWREYFEATVSEFQAARDLPPQPPGVN